MLPTNEPPIVIPELSVVERVIPLTRSDGKLIVGGVVSTNAVVTVSFSETHISNSGAQIVTV